VRVGEAEEGVEEPVTGGAGARERGLGLGKVEQVAERGVEGVPVRQPRRHGRGRRRRALLRPGAHGADVGVETRTVGSPTARGRTTTALRRDGLSGKEMDRAKAQKIILSFFHKAQKLSGFHEIRCTHIECLDASSKFSFRPFLTFSKILFWWREHMLPCAKLNFRIFLPPNHASFPPSLLFGGNASILQSKVFHHTLITRFLLFLLW
jgi:hypothetical protein